MLLFLAAPSPAWSVCLSQPAWGLASDLPLFSCDSACVCVRVCGQAHAYMFVWRPDMDVKCLPQSL